MFHLTVDQLLRSRVAENYNNSDDGSIDVIDLKGKHTVIAQGC